MLCVSASSTLCASTWLEAGQVAPYPGNLRTQLELADDTAMYEQLESNISLLMLCKAELDEERRRSDRWYKRPSVWVAISAVTFTVGLGIGIGCS